MITLIGSRCKTSNRFSRGVLIPRFLLGNVNIALPKKGASLLCPVIWNESIHLLCSPRHGGVKIKDCEVGNFAEIAQLVERQFFARFSHGCGSRRILAHA